MKNTESKEILNNNLIMRPNGSIEPDGELFEQLVKNAIEGNREALTELCIVIAKDVLFIATRILGNNMDAEDAAQETCIRMCENIHKLKDTKAFNAWLSRITTNESRRIIQKTQKINTTENLIDYTDIIEETDEELLPQTFILREGNRKIIIEIIDSLPERQREAVLLHYYQGLTLTQTAEAMDVARQVTSRYLQIAREKIRDELCRMAKSANTDYSDLYGLAAMPAGPVMARALEQEALHFVPASQGWLQKVLINAKFGPEHLAPKIFKSGAMKMVVVLTGAIIISGALLIGMQDDNEKYDEIIPPPPIVLTEAEGTVMFASGNDSSSPSNINPIRAEADAKNESGKLTALRWWITPLGNDKAIYQGDGHTVDSPLVQLIEQHKAGDYKLNFLMEDIYGCTYVLSRQFSIK